MPTNFIEIAESFFFWIRDYQLHTDQLLDWTCYYYVTQLKNQEIKFIMLLFWLI